MIPSRGSAERPASSRILVAVGAEKGNDAVLVRSYSPAASGPLGPRPRVSAPPRRRLGPGPVVAAATALVLLLSACGSSSSGSKATGSTASGATGGATASTATSPAALLAASYKGVLGTPPTTPAAATGSRSVWVVSCGESVPTCSRPAAAAVVAAKAAGWSAKVCDGQLNPQGWAACIRQGISNRAGGILIVGLDCVSFPGALKEAKAAGIPTVAVGGVDCDVTGGKPLYSAVVKNLPSMSAQAWWEKMGALQADWIIGKTDGKGKVLSLRFSDGLFGPWIEDGFKNELKSACAGCSVASTINVGNQDVTSGQLAQKFSTALLQNPTVNAVNVPLDGWFFAGVAQAIKASGRSDQLSVIGNFGEPGNVNFIRTNAGEDASVGFAAGWTSWSGVDALVRLADKLPIQPAGVGLQVIDKDHNLPSSKGDFAYDPASDYAAAYTKAWGKS